MNSATRRALPAAAALLLFLACGAALLWPALFGHQILWAGGYFVRLGPFPAELQARAPAGIAPLSDSVQCFVPWLRFAADGLRADGSLPLWKDTAGAGAPLLGNGQSALFFPTNLLAILLGAPPIVHALSALLKFAGGAFCAWLLARHLRLSFIASVLCGLVFGFGGFQAAWNLFPLTNVSLLLPLLVLAVDRLAARPSAAGVALLAGVAGLQHLGGHPETAFHCQVAALALGCARSLSLRAEIGGGPALRRIGWIAAGLCLGLLLAAIQVLPLLEYVAHSELLLRRAGYVAPPLHPVAGLGFGLGVLCAVLALRHLARSERGSLLAALMLGGSMFGGLLAGLAAGMQPTFVMSLLPDWFGGPDRFIGPGYYVSHAGAFAGAAFPLAVLGVMAGQPRGLAKAAGVVAGVGLLAGFGVPLLTDVLHRLPVFDVALNDRLQLLCLLATAVLAAFGLDALPSLRAAGARRRLLWAVLMPVLGAFAALACSVPLELVSSSNLPARAHPALVEAQLLPAAKVAPIFADEPPLEDPGS
ncbi:MAG TPA: hypothetical protein VES36_00860, partial [Candidatus Limnocylindrales bacterium]|nr:hypothetical protein [Candidatus Limnocylindrales bacterium]